MKNYNVKEEEWSGREDDRNSSKQLAGHTTAGK
jgi:hypothetical protein